MTFGRGQSRRSKDDFITATEWLYDGSCLKKRGIYRVEAH